MKRQDVDLIRAHQAVDDSVGPSNDLANLGIVEFGNGATRFGEGRELLGGRNKLADNNRCVVWRILGDEGVDGGEI